MRAQGPARADAFRQAFDLALGDILADITTTLPKFGVRYDQWFSERSLATMAPSTRLDLLRKNGVVYERRRRVRATDFGDEKDRVVVRENG